MGRSYGDPGAGSRCARSSSSKCSLGRRRVVPWMRLPASSRAHRISPSRPCSRPTQPSPLKPAPRTYLTADSTRGLSVGRPTRAGSMTKPLDCAYSRKATLKVGAVASALVTTGADLAHAEAVQRPVWHRAAATPEQHVDLGQGHLLLEPLLDELVLGGQLLPAAATARWSPAPHRHQHRADRRVGQQCLAAAR